MKTFAVYMLGVIFGFVLAAGLFQIHFGDSCTQQQAGHQAVSLHEQDQAIKRDTIEVMQARLDLKDEVNQKLRVKLALAQAATVKLSKLDQEVQEIKARAARMAPVEAAVKEVAKQEGGFLPGAVRGQWAEVVLRAFGRGK